MYMKPYLHNALRARATDTTWAKRAAETCGRLRCWPSLRGRNRTICQLDLQALEEPLDTADFLAILKKQPLVRTGGLRCFYLDQTVSQGVCYVDGERHAFDAAAMTAVKALCDHDQVTAALLRPALKQPVFLATLTQWVNAGYWYFQD